MDPRDARDQTQAPHRAAYRARRPAHAANHPRRGRPRRLHLARAWRSRESILSRPERGRDRHPGYRRRPHPAARGAGRGHRPRLHPVRVQTRRRERPRARPRFRAARRRRTQRASCSVGGEREARRSFDYRRAPRLTRTATRHRTRDSDRRRIGAASGHPLARAARRHRGRGPVLDARPGHAELPERLRRRLARVSLVQRRGSRCPRRRGPCGARDHRGHPRVSGRRGWLADSAAPLPAPRARAAERAG